MNSQCFDQERFELPISSVIDPTSSPCNPRSTTEGGRLGSRVTIDMLPDVVLLTFFDLYMNEEQIEAWRTLVHVCRKWRNIVFGSPRRLNLRLYCTASTPVRETLSVWPLLPIIVCGGGHKIWGTDNIIAALEHNNRICEINLWRIPSSQIERVLAAMQQPFPEMTRLVFRFENQTAPVVPASFLGGFAPRLKSLFLYGAQFPGLPNLLFSATHLVRLDLWGIPHSAYISPEAIVTCLSVLTKLERLEIGFEDPQCRPDRNSRRPPLPTRTLLPVLFELWFKGVSEYLEDLVARIDTPLLDDLDITIFHQLIFNTSQLSQFISRTPKFKAHKKVHIVFSSWDVLINLPPTFDGTLKLRISCRQPDWQLSSLAQACGSSFPQAIIRAVEHLYIHEVGFCVWQDGIEDNQWLELFHPFTAVKDLYISSKFTPRIAPSLQELVGESATEILPTLQTLFFEETPLSGPVEKAIGQFVDARQHAGHPIAVSRWERNVV